MIWSHKSIVKSSWHPLELLWLLMFIAVRKESGNNTYTHTGMMGLTNNQPV